MHTCNKTKMQSLLTMTMVLTTTWHSCSTERSPAVTTVDTNLSILLANRLLACTSSWVSLARSARASSLRRMLGGGFNQAKSEVCLRFCCFEEKENISVLYFGFR